MGISKKTVTKALNVSKLKIMIAFNVKIAINVREYAKCQSIEIIESDIMYHLQTKFEKYMESLQKKEKMSSELAVFPVEFALLSPEHIFRNKNPLIFGVRIKRGCLYLNIPICVKRKGGALYLGKVNSIKYKDKNVQKVEMGKDASICIQGEEEQKNIQFGKSFDISDIFVSQISRDSIDSLKDNFKEEMLRDKDIIPHLVGLKKYFGIGSLLMNKCDEEEKENDYY